MGDLNSFRHGNIIIYGLPCSGKTSIGKALAACIGMTHLSIGDSIRDSLQRQSIPLEVLTAYQGEAEYPLDWLQSLPCLQHNLLLSPRVIDASPPFHEIFSTVSLKKTTFIFISTPDPIRKLRFKERSSAPQMRADDLYPIFLSRSEFMRKRLKRAKRTLGQLTAVIDVDGAADIEACVRRILMEMTLNAALPYRPSCAATDLSCASKVSRLLSITSTAPFSYRDYRLAEPRRSDSREIVMLLKPGITASLNTISEIYQRLEKYDGAVTGIERWPKTEARSYVIDAHFGLHYVAWRWPSSVRNLVSMDRDSLSSGSGSTPVKISGRLNRSQKISDCIWIRASESGQLLINQHMPQVLDSLKRSPHPIFALSISVRHLTIEKWKDIRVNLLGASIPEEAHPESLRGLHFRGRIDALCQSSWENNGFHLSSSAMDAIREMKIWFNLSDGTYLM